MFVKQRRLGSPDKRGGVRFLKNTHAQKSTEETVNTKRVNISNLLICMVAISLSRMSMIFIHDFECCYCTVVQFPLQEKTADGWHQ